MIKRGDIVQIEIDHYDVVGNVKKAWHFRGEKYIRMIILLTNSPLLKPGEIHTFIGRRTKLVKS